MSIPNQLDHEEIMDFTSGKHINRQLPETPIRYSTEAAEENVSNDDLKHIDWEDFEYNDLGLSEEQIDLLSSNAITSILDQDYGLTDIDIGDFSKDDWDMSKEALDSLISDTVKMIIPSNTVQTSHSNINRDERKTMYDWETYANQVFSYWDKEKDGFPCALWLRSGPSVTEGYSIHKIPLEPVEMTEERLNTRVSHLEVTMRKLSKSDSITGVIGRKINFNGMRDWLSHHNQKILDELSTEYSAIYLTNRNKNRKNGEAYILRGVRKNKRITEKIIKSLSMVSTKLCSEVYKPELEALTIRDLLNDSDNVEHELFEGTKSFIYRAYEDGCWGIKKIPKGTKNKDERSSMNIAESSPSPSASASASTSDFTKNTKRGPKRSRTIE